jgi:hypothetical protein
MLYSTDLYFWTVLLTQWRNLIKRTTTLSRNFLNEIVYSTNLYFWTVLLTTSFGYSGHCGLDSCCFPLMNMFIPFVLSNKKIVKNCLFVFLGSFAKFRKATINFGMSVRPSVRPSVRQVESHWMDFREIRYLNIFRNSIEKIQV